ncbi:unnamed protein product [Arabidopsis lyrata]|nr:unnamed protein product [Arabidopsis lyrata]CAH8267959.1 unnamed protein product [Arabidopsis lyrata]
MRINVQLYGADLHPNFEQLKAAMSRVMMSIQEHMLCNDRHESRRIKQIISGDEMSHVKHIWRKSKQLQTVSDLGVLLGQCCNQPLVMKIMHIQLGNNKETRQKWRSMNFFSNLFCTNLYDVVDALQQVIVGFDTMEMIKEMELMGLSDSDFETEDDESGEDDSEDTGEDEYEEEWVAVLEDDDDDDDDDDESLADWANLETMRSCHPMFFFLKRMTEVASDDLVDWMDQPSAGLAIQGILSHILVEDYSDIQRKLADNNSTSTNRNKDAENLEEKLADISKACGEESDIDSSQGEKERTVVAFYKLEMIRIQLITPQAGVEVEDVRKAQPDVIAHASAGIISRLEESGDKVTEALKSLCWRHNGIQAEVLVVYEYMIDRNSFLAVGSEADWGRFPRF